MARLYQTGVLACFTRQLRRLRASAIVLARHDDGAAGESVPDVPASTEPS